MDKWYSGSIQYSRDDVSSFDDDEQITSVDVSKFASTVLDISDEEDNYVQEVVEHKTSGYHDFFRELYALVDDEESKKFVSTILSDLTKASQTLILQPIISTEDIVVVIDKTILENEYKSCVISTKTTHIDCVCEYDIHFCYLVINGTKMTYNTMYQRLKCGLKTAVFCAMHI